ncbi:MAG: hypothetical protein LOY02_16600, partial [Intrasporangium sp.]|nr:hypothetical protein [Intrasporangium sp.]
MIRRTARTLACVLGVVSLTALAPSVSATVLDSQPSAVQSATAGKDDKDRYKDKAKKVQEKKDKKIDQQDRDAAAARALQEGAVNPLMMMDAQAAALPGEAPRYFSHPNYANSPLPELTTAPGADVLVGNDVVQRSTPTDGAANVLVMSPGVLSDGFLNGFQTFVQAGSENLPFHAYVLRPTGTADEYSVVFDSGQLSTPATPGVATFPVANLEVQAGDRIAHHGRGIPFTGGSGTDSIYYPTSAVPAQGSTITLGAVPYPAFTSQARTYSFAASMVGADEVTVTGGIRKFVDPLPEIPAAVADTTTFPGSDFYRIGLVEYTQQLHSDLPAAGTKLRGYVQLNPDGTPMGTPSYLGPAIVAQRDKPVRIEFHNKLPTGAAGNLFLPVDTTVMGAGMTPDGHEAMENMDPGMIDPQVPMCNDPATKPAMVVAGHCYSDNRAIVHLHGGITPWISDGTPHQWITPANENTPFPEGVSVKNVPDMANVDDPADGVQTFYYTNAQSARLMFYHDHSWGITRL